MSEQRLSVTNAMFPFSQSSGITPPLASRQNDFKWTVKGIIELREKDRIKRKVQRTSYESKSEALCIKDANDGRAPNEASYRGSPYTSEENCREARSRFRNRLFPVIKPYLVTFGIAASVEDNSGKQKQSGTP